MKKAKLCNYTQYSGLAWVTNWVKFKFAVVNLKNHVWKWMCQFYLLTFRFFLEYTRNPITAALYIWISRQTAIPI